MCAPYRGLINTSAWKQLLESFHPFCRTYSVSILRHFYLVCCFSSTFPHHHNGRSHRLPTFAFTSKTVHLVSDELYSFTFPCKWCATEKVIWTFSKLWIHIRRKWNAWVQLTQCERSHLDGRRKLRIQSAISSKTKSAFEYENGEKKTGHKWKRVKSCRTQKCSLWIRLVSKAKTNSDTWRGQRSMAIGNISRKSIENIHLAILKSNNEWAKLSCIAKNHRISAECYEAAGKKKLFSLQIGIVCKATVTDWMTQNIREIILFVAKQLKTFAK